jgi:hypothetical protein
MGDRGGHKYVGRISIKLGFVDSALRNPHPQRTLPIVAGSQTLPRDGAKSGGHHDDIVRIDSHSDDATYTNNNTLKRPTSRAREGYGSVRERDMADGGRMPEREAPVSNAAGPRRQNGKLAGQQQMQQPPPAQVS